MNISNAVNKELEYYSDYNVLSSISSKYGESFYILHTEQFECNFAELKEAFSRIYPKFNIAYSYKTNYIPRLCQKVQELGGYAEVVSDMEITDAIKSGIPAEMIIFNGPYKNPKAVEMLLIAGGTVNLDSVWEIDNIRSIHEKYPDTVLNLGIRVNYEINDNVLSRFGFDVKSMEFRTTLEYLTSTPNIHFTGFHVHIAKRNLKTWRPRAEEMLKLIDEYGIIPEHIDIGGGLYGKMPEDFKSQFCDYIPSYEEYAKQAASLFAEHYTNLSMEQKPLLLIEPGSALVGDCMSLVCKVKSIKKVRNKTIATLLGSMYNINIGTKNPSIVVVQDKTQKHDEYTDVDFAGFTCIESDYLYRGYNGELAVGDYVIVKNVGSYSIVFKPPFILPNFSVIGYDETKTDKIDLIKRPETFDDVFQTYIF